MAQGIEETEHPHKPRKQRKSLASLRTIQNRSNFHMEDEPNGRYCLGSADPVYGSQKNVSNSDLSVRSGGFHPIFGN
jgi:hypothetical protein